MVALDSCLTWDISYYLYLKLISHELPSKKQTDLRYLQTRVLNIPYMMGLAALFNGARLCTNVDIALIVGLVKSIQLYTANRLNTK